MNEVRRTEIANSYLDHILLATKVGDSGAPFRDFLDNWYAFKVGTGHLTKGSRPIWFNNPCAWTHRVALGKMHFVSRNARAVLEHARTDTSRYLSDRKAALGTVRLMVDHAVPLRVLIDSLFRSGSELGTRDALDTYLHTYYRLGVITAAEDKRLNEAGLRSRMPADWDRQDVFARYRVANVAEGLPTDVADDTKRQAAE